MSRKEVLQELLAPCGDCGKDISSRADTCPNCGAPTLNTRPKRHKTWHQIAAATLSVAAILIVIGFGFVHVITGSSLSTPRVVRKDSFGYGETFIHIDKITGMPWVFAKSKYPIGCKVLQEKGHIESDEAFERRV
ncbi:MAG: zinc ribbon domain-containing protein, partial [Planctomycetota bacterium]